SDLNEEVLTRAGSWMSKEGKVDTATPFNLSRGFYRQLCRISMRGTSLIVEFSSNSFYISPRSLYDFRRIALC
ncbi:hypothetical protein AVEN_198973-1, partial [Araneus ventricosus]